MDERFVELVPGPSLRLMTKLFVVGCVASALIGVGTGLLVIAVGRTLPRAVFDTLFFLLFGAAILTAIAFVIAIRQRNREAERGYTSASAGFINLATVDDRTGRILREAGEPLLTPDEYRNRPKSGRTE